MITKNDCLTALVALEDHGVDINPAMKKLLSSKEIPFDVLKFILDNRGMEVYNFYEMLRKNHNKKKSPLYHNIMKDLEDPDDVITTLACLLVQITLYGRKLTTSREVFNREARAEEITRVLNNYYTSGTLDQCIALLRLFKTDIIVLEHIVGKRECL
jgi:hypothetical protein